MDSLDRLWQRPSPKDKNTPSGQHIFSKNITRTIIILAVVIGLLILSLLEGESSPLRRTTRQELSEELTSLVMRGISSTEN